MAWDFLKNFFGGAKNQQEAGEAQPTDESFENGQKGQEETDDSEQSDENQLQE